MSFSTPALPGTTVYHVGFTVQVVSSSENRNGVSAAPGPVCAGERVVEDVHLGGDHRVPPGLLGVRELVGADHVEDDGDRHAAVRQRGPVLEHAVRVGLVLRIELGLRGRRARLDAGDAGELGARGCAGRRGGGQSAHTTRCLPREHGRRDHRGEHARVKRDALTHGSLPFRSIA